MLDIDDTDDAAHGQQELALFNAHYDCTCFQLIHIFDGLTGKPILALLRPGKRPSGERINWVRRMRGVGCYETLLSKPHKGPLSCMLGEIY